MYQVVTPNERLLQAYQNVLYGKPDCWDVHSEHNALAEAEAAAKGIAGRKGIRMSDDPNPNNMISDFYRINPARDPVLAERVQNDTHEAAAYLGKLGGSRTSERKTAAVRENGKLGGRPKKS